MFSDHFIKRYIPRIWLDFLNLLTIKGNANKFRSQPKRLVFKKGETTVEVRAAHTYSMTVLIKGNNGRYDEIEFLWLNLRARFRLP